MTIASYTGLLRYVKLTVTVLIAAILSRLDSVAAETLHLYPGSSFESAAEALAPGDTLIVHAGEYASDGRVSINVKGTQQMPVVITGAEGEPKPVITRRQDASVQNTINIEGAEYLTIHGIEVSSNGGDGVNLSGEPSNVTLEELDIHDISVGINFRSSMHHIFVLRNHIYRTNETGEGMYVGCNNATCTVSDSVIENNWIHDTLAADQGDGIEIKRGSHSNIIRNNVIHDTNWPCILLYGTEGNPRNVVEGNVMWNCGDSGIQVAADAIVRNNIILESPENGLNSQPHQGVEPANLDFVHNTVVGGDPCVRVSNWANKQGIVFANNAIYCASGSYSIGDLAGVVVTGNVISPETAAFPDIGYAVGNPAGTDLGDPAGRNVYPTTNSALRGAGDPSFAALVDFNNLPRSGAADAGAYQWSGSANPGWMVAPGFKGATSTIRRPLPPDQLDAN